MKFLIDHDFHIHSHLSVCSNDAEQTTLNILKYAVENDFKKIILTDHFWDENILNKNSFYDIQNYSHVSSALPLPQTDGIEFLFGCETDMDIEGNIGISEKYIDKFDFIIVPTTHMHMYPPKEPGAAARAKFWMERYYKLLNSNLPFKKVGVAHITCTAIDVSDWEAHLNVIDLISDKDFEDIFKETANKGIGVELNFPALKYEKKDLERVFRPYRIAKQCGCKFYLGSDAHHLRDFDVKEKFEFIINTLNLEETDKFCLK